MSPHSVVVQALPIRPFQLGSRLLQAQKAVESPILVEALNPVRAFLVSNWEQ